MQFQGDQSHTLGPFDTLEEALSQDLSFDIEDDRIVIWEVLLPEHRKPVWNAFGWHWWDEFGLGQGKLPGYEKTLYLLMEEYYDDWDNEETEFKEWLQRKSK